jgi:YhcN/YlaJ family sporulation lipoprotein
MKKKKLIITLVLLLTFSLVISFACAPQRRPAPAPDNNMTQNQNKTNTNDTARAKAIRDSIVKNHKDINGATVVLSDSTAYVGLDLKGNVSGSTADRLKTEVADTVKNQDRSIDRVLVSSDVKIVTRLKQIGRDIENGRPISGFINELDTMFRRVTPSGK